MGQHIFVLVLPKDWVFIPGTDLMAHNHMLLKSQGICCPILALVDTQCSHGTQTPCRQTHIHTYK